MNRITATDGIELITSMGLPVEVKSFSDVSVAERNARLFVRQAPPSPASIRGDDRGTGIRLYIVPRMTAGLRELATEDHRIAIAAVADGVLIFDGHEHRSTLVSPAAEGAHSTRRVAWGRYAIMRVLARTRMPRTQAQLANECGVTQAAISQSLQRLGVLVAKSAEGWSARDILAIAEEFLTQYPGPRGITTGWYSLDPVTRQAETVVDIAAADVLVSGDAGADLIAPWRKPTRTVVYGATGLDLATHGFAESDLATASLEYTVPADPTMWATARAFASGRRPQAADPLICAFDVRRIGGPDAEDAVEHLIARLERNWAAG